VSKIIVDTIESSGTTVTVNDNLDAGTNAVTAGSITGLTATSITSGTLAAARLPAGTIVQTVQNSYTTEFTQSFDGDVHSYVNNGIEDLYVTIIPSSPDNKILVTYCLGRVCAVVGGGANWGFGLIAVRDGGLIQINTGTNSPKTTFSAGITYPSYARGLTFSFVDSPGSSTAVTYKLKAVGHNGDARSAGFNRGDTVGTTTNLGYQDVTVTNFIAQEIVG